jgi:uncharacterized protein Yka (UPF0111/DUF47 family)
MEKQMWEDRAESYDDPNKIKEEIDMLSSNLLDDINRTKFIPVLKRFLGKYESLDSS